MSHRDKLSRGQMLPPHGHRLRCRSGRRKKNLHLPVYQIILLPSVDKSSAGWAPTSRWVSSASLHRGRDHRDKSDDDATSPSTQSTGSSNDPQGKEQWDRSLPIDQWRCSDYFRKYTPWIVRSFSYVVLRVSHEPAIRYLMDCGDFLGSDRDILDDIRERVFDNEIDTVAPVVLEDDIGVFVENHTSVNAWISCPFDSTISAIPPEATTRAWKATWASDASPPGFLISNAQKRPQGLQASMSLTPTLRLDGFPRFPPFTLKAPALNFTATNPFESRKSSISFWISASDWSIVISFPPSSFAYQVLLACAESLFSLVYSVLERC